MLHVEWTRQGGGTTYVYPMWRVNEMSVSENGELYRRTERANGNKREAVRFANEIAKAEGHEIVVFPRP